MRNPIAASFLVLAAIAAASQAAAEIREVAPGRYLCEAEAGEAQRLDVTGFFGQSNVMAARVTVLEARRHPNSWSAAGLVFALDSGREPRIVVMDSLDTDQFLWVVLDPDIENTYSYEMESYRGGSTVEISGTMSRGAIFARSRNARGQIYVARARLVRREIMCSSGRFEIELVRAARRGRRY
ncbi:MAG TPA: hypothetical protein VF704_11860 [Allosphingosinicella sp.]|jgi:hypothetical protein